MLQTHGSFIFFVQLRLHNFKKLQLRGGEFGGGEVGGGWCIKTEEWPVSREFSVIQVLCNLN